MVKGREECQACDEFTWAFGWDGGDMTLIYIRKALSYILYTQPRNAYVFLVHVQTQLWTYILVGSTNVKLSSFLMCMLLETSATVCYGLPPMIKRQV